MTDSAPSAAELAAVIDHTLLKPEATRPEVARAVGVAASHGCASVCVQPSMVAYANEVAGGRVPVCSVVGFPHGANLSETKATEAALAVAAGASEIDMVADLSALADGDEHAVSADVARVRAAVPHVVLKVILESALLSPLQLRGAVEAAVLAGSDFVKTSTGFHPSGGASRESVQVMAEACAGRARVKASGGIRDLETAMSMLSAGADRLGLSGTEVILESAAAGCPDS